MAEGGCCPFSEPDERATVYNTEKRRARKRHVCDECRDPIEVAALHEYTSMLFDGTWSTFRICLMCSEIGDHFNCGGRVIGELWRELEENFFPDMTAGGPCMDGLSPAAKARLFEKRLEWVYGQDEYEPCDRALPPAWKESKEAWFKAKLEAERQKWAAFYQRARHNDEET